ncbi:MAG: hypothetical protein BroJett011_07830 [Chloroflexota bacterium]|nr:MAG: hypothetical protein BroJett011_07830 [Chloroflexota bacterium]
MSTTDSINDTIIMGRVVSDPQYNNHDGCIQFSIRTSEGTFFIKAYGLESYRLCERLEEGHLVTVIGSLHSYIGKKCQSHHVYIKAKTLMPVDESPAFRNLITLLGAQTIYRARSNNGYESSPDEENNLEKNLSHTVTLSKNGNGREKSHQKIR